MSKKDDGGIIIRYAELDNGKSELDEIVASNASIHLEQMDDNHWWMSIRTGSEEIHVNLCTKRAPITGYVEEQ